MWKFEKFENLKIYIVCILIFKLSYFQIFKLLSVFDND